MIGRLPLRSVYPATERYAERIQEYGKQSNLLIDLQLDLLDHESAVSSEKALGYEPSL